MLALGDDVQDLVDHVHGIVAAFAKLDHALGVLDRRVVAVCVGDHCGLVLGQVGEGGVLDRGEGGEGAVVEWAGYDKNV